MHNPKDSEAIGSEREEYAMLRKKRLAMRHDAPIRLHHMV
jgi:hypothetical protein